MTEPTASDQRIRDNAARLVREHGYDYALQVARAQTQRIGSPEQERQAQTLLAEVERARRLARTPENPHSAAAERVASFLEAWEMHPSRGDIIYGLGVLKEETSRDLLASDLRLLLTERQAITDVLQGIEP